MKDLGSYQTIRPTHLRIIRSQWDGSPIMRPGYYRHIPPVGPVVSGTARASCGGSHIMPVAPVVRGSERVSCGHIRPMALAVGGRRGCKPGTERVGS